MIYRTGLILAAGFGSRLEGTVEVTPLKPLTPVAGTPLIFRTIKSLIEAGCNRIVIVLGHGNELIQTAISDNFAEEVELRFVYNNNYDLKNGVSVLAARELIEDEFILTMADHLLGKKVMQLAGQHAPPIGGATLLVDYKIDSVFDLDDATKVQEENNRIINIGKQIKGYNCIDTGVFVCTQGLMDALEQIYNRKGNVSLSEGVQLLAEKNLMHTLDIKEGFWQDVDTPEMLKHAEELLNNNNNSFS